MAYRRQTFPALGVFIRVVKTKFEDAGLQGTEFINTNLSGARFHDINLSGAELVDINLSRTVIRNVNCSHVVIEDACYEGMTLDGILVTELLRVYRAQQAGVI